MMIRREINYIEINCPAKINFGLNIVNKRDDGFHNIETIFYPIELADKLYFTKNRPFSFAQDSGLELLNDEDNIVVKAVRLLEKFSARKLDVEIKLEKKIPIGAGLGGGSSDAAHTLLSLNEMFHIGASEELIRKMALSLGSDVPFFIRPIPSFASGRGEEIEVIDFEINKPMVLINPRIHVSTPWAYKNCKPLVPKYSLLNLKDEVSPNLTQLKSLVVNDFEEIVFAQYPEIAVIKETLYEQGASFALMSGSGSSVFGFFESNDEADRAVRAFSAKYFTFVQHI